MDFCHKVTDVTHMVNEITEMDMTNILNCAVIEELAYITNMVNKLTNVRDIADMKITCNTKIDRTGMYFTYRVKLTDITYMINEIANFTYI